ncbi:hypothetical protein [Anaeropeptidivorans aminofermentans]|uniref:hypothetical protein n=1 Tax=Anaeropeptidivorans aminofermentans TaxID=2934315 RepID=UPI002025A2E0|nr:hypothetical protein [Anaeropeptidivorans aminofermentans]
MISERVKEFAAAGREAGDAYATAFNSAVASIMASTDSYSASAASAQMAALTQRPSVTTNNVQLYQSINTPPLQALLKWREKVKRHWKMLLSIYR